MLLIPLVHVWEITVLLSGLVAILSQRIISNISLPPASIHTTPHDGRPKS